MATCAGATKLTAELNMQGGYVYSYTREAAPSEWRGGAAEGDTPIATAVFPNRDDIMVQLYSCTMVYIVPRDQVVPGTAVRYRCSCLG